MQRADLEGQNGQTASKSSGRRALPVINNLKPQKSANELAIEEELRRFEAEQRAALGLDRATTHFTDPNPQHFTRAQRPKTTVLVGGLTIAHDYLISATLAGLGYHVETLDNPDSSALQLGKEFGNRGQCNPTYFNVGNLVKRLNELHAQGLSPQQIVDGYVFVMPGACGPCRFGSYVTEYRKALRDAGFDGFRVLLFQQQGGLKQVTGDDPGLDLNPKFFVSLLFAIMVGDAVNAIGYRMRPYETQPGATDRALEECKRTLAEMLRTRSNPVVALLQCRRRLRAVEVDRTQVKPKVAVIGEFWAMTTEGDGNYGLQRFLEHEGAEVDIQIVTNWVLYNIWEHSWDTRQRMTLRQDDNANKGLVGVNAQQKLATLWVADKGLRLIFKSIAGILGLHDYYMPNMDEVAEEARELYNNHLRGGEGHMEVGKLVMNVKHKKSTMTLSVKPFGCMPSSGVSDGVQSYVTEKWPSAIFLPIETSGDGAVNVYSRVQMMLFKARVAARAEFEATCQEYGVTPEELRLFIAQHSRFSSPFFWPSHRVAATASDIVHEVAPYMKDPLHGVKKVGRRILGLFTRSATVSH
ncbi:MAG: 2-hydroxyglutaryl-CoA dehydratase [Deltaproteobacteria bacterium]|nr:2-hydroxyglutaryl-CoA dehydratase [Deltaproteobacteria bacterium]